MAFEQIKTLYPKLYNNLNNYVGYQNNNVFKAVNTALDRGYDLSYYNSPNRGPSTLVRLLNSINASDNPSRVGFPSTDTENFLNIIDNAPGHNDLESLYKFLQLHRGIGIDTTMPALESAKTFFPDLFDFYKYGES